MLNDAFAQLYPPGLPISISYSVRKITPYLFKVYLKQPNVIILTDIHGSPECLSFSLFP